MLASGPILGVIAGWLLRGDISRLGAIRIRWWPVLAGAVALRLLGGSLGPLAPVSYVAAFAAIVAVALVNVQLPGMALIAGGALLNLVVVVVNGGMPVDAGAVAAAGGRMPSDALHIPLTDRTALALLADRIPVPIFAAAYSAGDVLLAAGGFWIPFAAMRRR